MKLPYSLHPQKESDAGLFAIRFNFMPWQSNFDNLLIADMIKGGRRRKVPAILDCVLAKIMELGPLFARSNDATAGRRPLSLRDNRLLPNIWMDGNARSIHDAAVDFLTIAPLRPKIEPEPFKRWVAIAVYFMVCQAPRASLWLCLQPSNPTAPNIKSCFSFSPAYRDGTTIVVLASARLSISRTFILRDHTRWRT